MFCLCQTSFHIHIHIHVMSICMSVPSCYWPAVWGGWRGSLSPSTWRGDPLPTPGFLKGDVTTQYSQSIAGITVSLLLRGIKREPQPLHSHWRSSSQASLPPPPSLANSVGGMDGSTDPGTWRWRRMCTSLPLNTSQRSYGWHWGRHWLSPAGLAMVICQVLAFFRPAICSYGWLAWPWTVTSPLLRQRALLSKSWLHSTFAPANCSGWELRLGFSLPKLDVRRGMTSPKRQETFSLLTSNLLVLIMLAYASGTLGLGLAQNVSLLWLNRRWTSYPPHLNVDSLLISAAGLAVSLAGSAVPFNVIVVVIIVSGVVIFSFFVMSSSSSSYHRRPSPVQAEQLSFSLYVIGLSSF